MELYTRVPDSGWEERPQGYRRAILKRTPTERIEIIELAPGGVMPPHFHSQKDETIVILKGNAEVTLYNRAVGFPNSIGCVDSAGTTIVVPRGTVHSVVAKDGVQYLVYGRSNGETPSIWVPYSIRQMTEDGTWNYLQISGHSRYEYAIYPADNPVGQAQALLLMNRVPRWQKVTGLHEPEQYLSRVPVADNIRIVLLYDCTAGSPEKSRVGAAFIGAAEGYDLEKTKAVIEHGKKDSRVLNKKSIWINYQSWEDVPGSAVTAFHPLELRKAWDTFVDACRDAFPDAEQVMVRSRHHEIWSYVYTAPWELVAQVDMRGFSWTAPDGQRFKDYNEKFSKYGILRLPLK